MHAAGPSALQAAPAVADAAPSPEDAAALLELLARTAARPEYQPHQPGPIERLREASAQAVGDLLRWVGNLFGFDLGDLELGLWLAVALALALLLWLGRLLWLSNRGRRGRARGNGPGTPVQGPSAAAELLRLAERDRARGDLPAAVRRLFGAAVAHLDESGALRARPELTGGELLAALRDGEQRRAFRELLAPYVRLEFAGDAPGPGEIDVQLAALARLGLAPDGPTATGGAGR